MVFDLKLAWLSIHQNWLHSAFTVFRHIALNITCAHQNILELRSSTNYKVTESHWIIALPQRYFHFPPSAMFRHPECQKKCSHKNWNELIFSIFHESCHKCVQWPRHLSICEKQSSNMCALCHQHRHIAIRSAVMNAWEGKNDAKNIHDERIFINGKCDDADLLMRRFTFGSA